jgi:hypothetical protein
MDAFSPTITVGAFVFPDTSVGMMEASATRSTGKSVDPQLRIHYCVGITSHFARPDGMENSIGKFTAEFL